MVSESEKTWIRIFLSLSLTLYIPYQQAYINRFPINKPAANDWVTSADAFEQSPFHI